MAANDVVVDPEEILRAHARELAASDSAHSRSVAAAIDWALGEIKHLSSPPPAVSPATPRSSEVRRRVPAPVWRVWVEREGVDYVFACDQNCSDAKYSAAAYFGTTMDKIHVGGVPSVIVNETHVRIWRDEMGDVQCERGCVGDGALEVHTVYWGKP